MSLHRSFTSRAASRWLVFFRPSHQTRSNLYRHVLGLVPALDYFENSLVVLFALYIAVGVNASSREYVWLTTAYSMASIFAILKQQWFVERIGFRAYLATTLLLYALFAIGSSLSTDLTELIIFRTLQGFCAGSWMSSTRTLAQLSIPAPQRPKALKFFILFIFLGTAIAPLAGSLLIENHTWRILLLIPAPLAIVLSLVVLLTFPRVGHNPERGEARYPFVPFMFFALGLGLIQIAIQEARYSSWEGTPWRGVLLAGFGGVLYFVKNQWSHPSPLLHLHSLRVREYQTGLVLYMFHYTIANALSFLMPQLLEQGLGYSVTTMGHALGISSLLGLLALPAYFAISPYIRHKKIIISFGFLVVIVLAWWASLLTPQAGINEVWGILLLRGIFTAFLVLPVANVTFRGFDEHKFIHGYRLKNIVRQLASLFSISLVVSIEQIRTATHHERLTEVSTTLNANFAETLNQLQQRFVSLGYTLEQAHAAALAQISAAISQQASFLSMLDTFRGLAFLALFGLLYTWWQKRID